MYKLLVYISFLFFGNYSTAQFITDHLVEINKSYDPLFASGKGELRASLDMTYQEGGGDTLINVIVSIEQLKANLVGSTKSVSVSGGGGSNSWGIIGALAGGFGSNKAYRYTNTLGVAFLNYEQLDSLNIAFSKLYQFASIQQGHPKTVLYKIGKILLGLDLQKKGNKQDGYTLAKHFYIQIDDSAFNLSEVEFNDLYGNGFKIMKGTWETFKKYHTIQTDLY